MLKKLNRFLCNYYTLSALIFIFFCIGQGCSDPSYDDTTAYWHWVCRPAVLSNSYVGATCDTDFSDYSSREQAYFRNSEGWSCKHFGTILIKQRCFDKNSPRSHGYDSDDVALRHLTLADPVIVGDESVAVLSLAQDGQIFRVRNNGTNFPIAFKSLNYFLSSKNYGPYFKPQKDYKYRVSPKSVKIYNNYYIFAAAFAPGKSSNNSYIARFNYNDINDNADWDLDFDRDTVYLASPVEVDFTLSETELFIPAGSYLYHLPASGNYFKKSHLTTGPPSSFGADYDPTIMPWRIGPFKKNIGIKIHPSALALSITALPNSSNANFKINKIFSSGDNKITSSPEVGGYKIFLTTETDILCLHKTGGVLLWSRPLIDTIDNNIQELNINKGRKTILHVPLTGHIYSSEGDYLVKRNAKNGIILWKKDLGSKIHACAAYWHDKKLLAAGTHLGKGYIINADSGETIFSENFSNGKIYVTPDFDIANNLGVFFSYGKKYGGLETIALNAGYITMLPTVLAMEGEIDYYETPTFHAKITSYPEFSSSGGGMTTFNKVEIKIGTTVTHTLKVTPDPGTGSGSKIIATYTDNAPRDPDSSGNSKNYSKISNGLKKTVSYPEGIYTLTLTSKYTTPENGPGVSSISADYYISQPYIPTELLTNPFKCGVPPLQFKAEKIISSGDPMLDKSMQALQIDEDRDFSVKFKALFNISVQKLNDERSDPREDFIIGPTTNRNAGPNAAKAACGIPYKQNERKIKLKIICQNDKGNYTPANIVTNNFDMPPFGSSSIIHVPKKWEFKLPTISDNNLWAQTPAQAGNFSGQVTERLLTGSVSYNYQQYNSQIIKTYTVVHRTWDNFGQITNEWSETFYKFKIYRSNVIWTNENSCFPDPLSISVRDKTPPEINTYPNNLEGTTGDPLEIIGISYKDNNTFDDKPLKYYIYLEKKDRNTLTGPADTTWAKHIPDQASAKAECHGVCSESQGLNKELKHIGSIDPSTSAILLSSTTSYPQVMLPTEYAGEKILRYGVVIEDNSGNVNPCCVDVLDNHEPENNYNLPSNYNHSTTTISEKTGFISVYDNDKPDIFLTIEPLSDSTTILQNLSKFEYTATTTLDGNTRFEMNIKSLSMAGETTEIQILTSNSGKDIKIRPGIEFPIFSKADDSIRFFSTLTPGACEKITDILYKAIPEDIKLNFYIKYEDNVKYLDSNIVKDSAEPLLIFYVDDIQNIVKKHEIGPYGYANSLWNIEKYDDNLDTTDDDIFREFVFREYNIDPESETPESTRTIRPIPTTITIPMDPKKTKTGITLSARDLAGNGREMEIIFPILKTNIDIFVLEQKSKVTNVK